MEKHHTEEERDFDKAFTQAVCCSYRQWKNNRSNSKASKEEHNSAAMSTHEGDDNRGNCGASHKGDSTNTCESVDDCSHVCSGSSNETNYD